MGAAGSISDIGRPANHRGWPDDWGDRSRRRKQRRGMRLHGTDIRCRTATAARSTNTTASGIQMSLARRKFIGSLAGGVAAALVAPAQTTRREVRVGGKRVKVVDVHGHATFPEVAA